MEYLPKPKRPLGTRLVRGIVKIVLYGVPLTFGLMYISENTPWLTRIQGSLVIKQNSPLFSKERTSTWTRNLIYTVIENYNLDIDEFEIPPYAFPSLEAFVSRKLKPRDIKLDPAALLAPADATLMSLRKIENNFIMTVKANEYSLGELLRGRGAYISADELQLLKLNPDNDFYSAVFYITHYDYRRIHAPSFFHINKYTYIRGKRIDYGQVVLNFRQVG